MKTSKKSTYNGPDNTNPTDWARDVNNDLEQIFLCLSGRIRFGSNNTTNNHGENIMGQFVTYTTNASANTEDSISHTLNSVPIGYLVVKQDKAGSIYSGSTAWTSNKIYLKGSASSMTVTLFLIQ